MGAKTFFKGLGNTLKNKAKSGANTLKSVTPTLYKDAKSGVSSVFNKVTDIPKQSLGTIERLGSKGLDTVGGIADSLAMPLLVIGSVAAFYFLTKKE
jgi:hypothetical protein